MRGLVFSTLLVAVALSSVAQESSEPTVPVVSYESKDPRSQVLTRVGFKDRLRTQVPMELSFRNHDGEMVALGDLFRGGRPVILMPVYYECPGICNAVLSGFVAAAQDIAATGDQFTIGTHYDVITFSFDHEETHILAEGKRSAHLALLDQPTAAEGWHFLVGDEEAIVTLCDSIGFSFEYDPKSGEYAHKSGLLMLTDEGIISRYLPGAMYPAKDLSFALVDAGKGSIGSFTTKFFAGCYRFDAETGKYTPYVIRALLFGCLLTVLLMVVVLSRLIRFDLRRQSAFAGAESETSDTTTQG